MFLLTNVTKIYYDITDPDIKLDIVGLENCEDKNVKFGLFLQICQHIRSKTDLSYVLFLKYSSYRDKILPCEGEIRKILTFLTGYIFLFMTKLFFHEKRI